MQGLAAKCLYRTSGWFLQCIGLGGEMRAIFLVANQRIADMGHVDPYLMRASGFEPAFDKARIGPPVTGTVKVADDGIVGNRLACIMPVSPDHSALEPV